MRNVARMLLMSNRSGERNRGMEPRYDHEPENRRYDDGSYVPQNNYAYSEYDVDSRFRDRRGREHYDNGRYAPQNHYDVWSDPTPMERYHGPRYEQDGMVDARGRSYGARNLIGFAREGQNNSPSMHSDATVPRYNEMERRSGNVVSMHRPDMYGSMEFTPELAKEWTEHMENEDGTKGPHWSLEQVEKVIAQRGLDCDPYKFWAIMNVIYSDDVKVAKKHNVNTMDYYVDRTLAWLNDKDAVGDKATAYYEYIVKH